jgi:hypothetical protein
MGHTTRIPDYDWDRGHGAKEVPEGYDPRDDHESTKRKSKVVEPEDDKPVSTTRTAKTKAK